MTLITATISTMLGKEVALILEVQQRPVVMVAAEIDASSTSAVATVRSAVGHVLGTAHVCGTSAALTRAALYLYVVYEIGFSHLFFSFYLFNE